MRSGVWESAKYHQPMSAAVPHTDSIGSAGLSRRTFLAGGAASLAMGVYGASHGRHEIEIVPLTLRIRNLPDSFQNFHFVQISDINLRGFTETWFLERVVERVNELKPELVVFTGDLVSRWPAHSESGAAGLGAEILERLTSPQRFAVLGNHDLGLNGHSVLPYLEAHNTPVLQNRHVSIDRGSDRIWLCGTEDVTYGLPRLREAVPWNPKEPVILLTHEPDFADNVVQHPYGKFVDLMLSGHSHGGQVRLPFAGPLVLPPLGRKYSMGSYQLGSMQLYVNRGVGTVGAPIRVNCAPEITQIRLVRA